MSAAQKQEVKDVATQAPGGALAAAPTGDWGAEAVDSKDLLIPKLLLMQGLSDAVADERAQMGDIVNSVTYEKLGDKKAPVEIIPLKIFKTWVISLKKKGEDKHEFDSIVNMDSSNADLPWEETLPDGTELRRDQTINVYALVASELTDGAALPYVVSFRRTSYIAGKKIATHFAKMSMLKQPPAARTVKLTCSIEKNEKGTYYTYDVEPGRVTTQDELATAYSWFTQVSRGAHKVDDSDVRQPEKEVSTEAGQPEGQQKF